MDKAEERFTEALARAGERIMNFGYTATMSAAAQAADTEPPQAPGAAVQSEEESAGCGGRVEAGGTWRERLTASEIKDWMRIQSLRGPHPCDGRVPSRSESADDEYEDDEITAVLAVIGVDPGRFRREKTRAVRRLVSEIYSPPRVTAMLKRMTNQGLTPGLALDLTTIDPDDGRPWDFDVTAEAVVHHRFSHVYQVVLLATQMIRSVVP